MQPWRNPRTREVIEAGSIADDVAGRCAGATARLLSAIPVEYLGGHQNERFFIPFFLQPQFEVL